MRHGIFLCAALAVAAALAGCSGGSAVVPPTSNVGHADDVGSAADERIAAAAALAAAATPKPTSTPPVYPLKPGDTFAYDYASQTTVKTSTTYETTQSFSGALTAVLSGLGTYNGVPAYTLRTTGSTSSGNASLDHSDYVNIVSSGGHPKYEAYGYDYSDEVNLGSGVTRHDHVTMTYATPFVNDVLPQTSGASWAEPVGLKETIDDYYQTSQNNPNILSGTETRASDGSYYASGMVTNVPETRLLRSNGTGQIVDGPASGAVEWSYALPQDKSSHEVIPATESYAGRSATNFVPDWYPGGKLPASPLAAASMKDRGRVKAPASCGKRSGTLATQLESTSSALDPIEGTTTSEVSDDFVVPGVGNICTLDESVQKKYDTENTGALIATTETITSQVLTSEVLK